ncbi:unnamed protein product [Ceutorhynchus assimilis]|uniref:DUF4806 domain-containing protein n=1 Tax=Ceutorhynchus assimilis TaxID=467358 RepID=A0A9N9MQC3_9CUCU|nr:unnamed protein product [Ceutorhynchus assimilis]
MLLCRALCPCDLFGFFLNLVWFLSYSKCQVITGSGNTKKNMYCVVQLDETGGEGLAVVHTSWLTPLKKEVFWPPIKDSKLYRKALVESEPVESDWTLYGVKKIYFQTGDLNKAFRKEKEAEQTSDIYDTDDATSVVINRPRKRIKRVLDSDDDSGDDSRFSRPPQIKIKQLSGSKEKKQISSPSTSKEQRPIAASEIFTPRSSLGSSLYVETPDIRDSSSIEKRQERQISLPSTSKERSTATSPQLLTIGATPYARTPDITESNLPIFINVLNTVKEQNKLILTKLENLETLIAGVPVVEAAVNSGNPLPIELPLISDDNINATENYLEEKRNFTRLVNYLGSLGGTNLKNKVHKILRQLLSNDLACSYSYFGKKGKKSFSELKLNKAIIQTTQLKIESASLLEIEDTIKIWLKHAPDRKKGQKKNDEVN